MRKLKKHDTRLIYDATRRAKEEQVGFLCYLPEAGGTTPRTTIVFFNQSEKDELVEKGRLSTLYGEFFFDDFGELSWSFTS